MKMKKQTLALTMSLALTLPMLAACGGQNGGSASSNGSAGDVELTFMTNVVGEKANALEAALKGFEEETGYKVEFSAPGSSYEELMKTKMSSNEMPDVFTTHGWSVARYSDYLMPVNDMEFASRRHCRHHLQRGCAEGRRRGPRQHQDLGRLYCRL